MPVKTREYRRCPVKVLLCLMIIVFLYGSNAWCDCKSDCQGEYQSDVESCKSNYNDPEDADDLKQCLDDAQKQYQECIQECANEDSSQSTYGGLPGLARVASVCYEVRSRPVGRSLLPIRVSALSLHTLSRHSLVR